MSFLCLGYGSPPPELVWKKNGEVLKETNRIKILGNSTFQLQIFSVGVEDAGTYECIYKNPLGEDSRSVLVTVDGQEGRGE